MPIKNAIIELKIYPFHVMVSMEEKDEQLSRQLKKYCIPDNEIKDYMQRWEEDINCRGRCSMFSGNQTLIRIRYFNKKSVLFFGYLQHEIFHAADIILTQIGMKLTEESDEAYAYLIDYLTQEIYTRFKLIKQ